MDRSTVIRLIAVSYTTDTSGTQQTAISSSRNVFCRVKSIGMKEAYAAMSVGRNPEICVSMAEASEYLGEQYAVVDGGRYKIIRVYQPGSGIELTMERTRDLEGML